MYRKSKTLSIFLGMLLLTTGLMAGCQSPQSTAGSTPATTATVTDAGESPAPAETANTEETLTVYTITHSVVLADPARESEDRIKLAIEKKLNIHLKIGDGTTEGYNDRLNLELMSGEGPDIWFGGVNPTMQDWINNGIVLDWAPYLKANPERYQILYKMYNDKDVQSLNKVFFGSADIMNAMFVLGEANNTGSYSFMPVEVLKATGYSFDNLPKTVYEFAEYCIAASKKGFDGWWPRNDKLTAWDNFDKVVGYALGTSFQWPSGPMSGMIYNYDTNSWDYTTVSDKSKEAIKLLKYMRANNGLHKGIGELDDWTDGEAGLKNGTTAAFDNRNYWADDFAEYVSFYRDAHQNQTLKYDETIAWSVPLTDKDGKRVTVRNNPHNIAYVWHLNAQTKSPERMLDLVEFLISDEGAQLLKLGIEGVHWNYDANGKKVKNMDEWYKDNSIWGKPWDRAWWPTFQAISSARYEVTSFEKHDSWLVAMTNQELGSWYHKDEEAYQWAQNNRVLTMYQAEGNYDPLPLYYSFISFNDDMNKRIAACKEVFLKYVPEFIFGNKDIDAEWDAYKADLEAAGASEIVNWFNGQVTEAAKQYGN